MSAWVALESRAKLVKGETVLVNGATGSAGTIAVQIAKHLGAKKVVATGRNRHSLNGLLSLGADETIALDDDGKPPEATFRKQFEQGVDVVLDYLWGPSAEQLMAAANAGRTTVPIRFVQIGTASAANITLPGLALRSSPVQLMGSGIGSVALEDIMRIISKLMRAASLVSFKIATKAMPLQLIGEAWSAKSVAPRIVFTITEQ
jgi:NADPH:quinone reductase-like Zn-dependent oxidoreductase